MVGPAARAWKARINRADITNPAHEATVLGWLINGPGFHPFWSWWLLTVISLRDIPGVPPAKKQYALAEWELMILSLNPEFPPPDPDTLGGMHHLTPPDLVYQFHGVGEDRVHQLAHVAIDAICKGEMSPDQDYRTAWKMFLDDEVSR